MIARVIGWLAYIGIMIYSGLSWIIIGLAIAAMGILQWWMRGIVKNAAKKAISAQPDTIHLLTATSPAWKQEETIKGYFNNLKSSGFTQEGIFTIKEMPGVIVAGFVSVKDSMYATVYQHPAGYVWCDIVATRMDGIDITVGNPPVGDELDQLPGAIKIIDKTATVAMLIEKIRLAAKDTTLKPAKTGDFVVIFENGYAKETAWRKKKAFSNNEADKFIDDIKN